MLMKAPVTVKEQHCVCTGGTEPEFCDFCSLALLPCWTDLAHLLICISPVLLSCCLSDAKKQRLSSEADLGGNLHPAPILSGGPRNVPLRGTGFQLLGLDVTSNCTLTFVLISHRGRLPARLDKYFGCFKPVNKSCQNRPIQTFFSIVQYLRFVVNLQNNPVH